MAALTSTNYENLNNVENTKPKNSACPPALGANDPLPAGYVAFAHAAVQRRNAARKAAGLGAMGGACGGRKHCVCSGLGCDDLWKEWIEIGCPHVGVMENNENFGLAGNIDNNNSNVSSIHSNNSFNTMAYKQSKQMEKEGNKRRNTRRRRGRANRRTRLRR